jgi:gas vesicle protein GvpN
MTPKRVKPTPQKSAVREEHELVGRSRELEQIRACLKANRNVLLEGPVGVGKTRLALELAHRLGRPVFRVDGDSRYTEQKLTGWFDPPLVLKKGYSWTTFVGGPLTEAMRSGGILFMNELNRLPEGVQNVLLPAIDERLISIPRLGEVRAAPGFLVIATQNPKEFVATSHLSEAILDRFELITLGYQSEEEELRIVQNRLDAQKSSDRGGRDTLDRLNRASVSLVRATRNHPRIRRGASVRASLAIAEIAAALLSEGADLGAAFVTAATIALPTRIELERDGSYGTNLSDELESLVRELAQEALSGSVSEFSKKKTN